MKTALFTAASVFLLLLFASPVFAEGPGSRLRAGTLFPQPPAPRPDATSCESRQGEERNRCLALQGQPLPQRTAEQRLPGKPSGPEAVGMGSGAGRSASPGSAAPR